MGHATLLALSRDLEAQVHCWTGFGARLNDQHQCDLLKPLPDFEAVEAEGRAKHFVLAYADAYRALYFCLTWPDLHTVARNGSRHGQMNLMAMITHF